MITLNNLVVNSNFEQLEYTDTSQNAIKCANWSDIYTRNHSYSTELDTATNTLKPVYLNNGVLDTKYSYSGTNSLLLNRNFAAIKSKKFSLTKEHVYYLMCYTFSPISTDNSKVKFKICRQDNTDMELNFTNKWQRNSKIFTSNENTTCSKIYIKNENTIEENVDAYYIDAILLIDLTESFGKHNEPSKEWCDKNIPYFTNSLEINEGKKVEILNLKDFTLNKENNIYYNNDEEVTLVFSIENFDKNQQDSLDRDLRIRYNLFEFYEENILLDEKSEKTKLTQVYYGDEGFKEENIISTYDNTVIFQITLNCDSKSIGKQFQLIGKNELYGKTPVKYLIFNWRSTNKFNILTHDFNDEVAVYKTYKHIIKGETNPYISSPTNINMYVNGTKLPDVKFIKNNYSNCTYEKELFLTDGKNKITIESVDIFNNITNRIDINAYVNILYDIIDKTELLKNFIGNDNQMLELTLGDCDLEYEDKNAGPEKNININTDILSKFFNLKGINSEYYRISRDDLPLIKGDIIQKPITITFDGVEKIYDGSNVITNELNKLKFEDGYYFGAVANQHSSYLATGFIKGNFERLSMNTVLFKTNDKITNFYQLNADTIDLDTFSIVIDGNLGLPTQDGDIVFEAIEKNREKIIKISNKAELLNIMQQKTVKGRLYCIYELIDKDNISKYVGVAIDSHDGDFKSWEYITENNDENNYKALQDKIINKLIGLDNALYGANVINTEDGQAINFHLADDVTDYLVKNEVTIKYNYRNKIDNKSTFTHLQSDAGKVKVVFDEAHFDNKNVTNEWKPITVNGLLLAGDTLGDESHNYQIANYSAYGRIVKRGVTAHIRCLDKIYDGTPYVPFELSNSYYHGLENSIEGDDVFIDDTYYENPVDNFHIFKQTGVSYLQFEDSNVADSKLVKIVDNMVLEGKDSSNYYLQNIICNYIASIKKRKIEVVIDKLRFIRSDLKWEMDYHFINAIPGDNLRLSFNRSDSNDFIVYGGISTSTINSIQYEIYTLNDLSGIKDIISMYFDYESNPNYKFKTPNVEIENVQHTNHLYWLNEARPAEPNTLRTDIKIEAKDDYPGGIKLDKSDNPYFESKNKDFKLYNNHMVKVVNLNLDSQNPISKNYELINTSLVTELEII